MPLLFTYPFEPVPPLAVYEQLEASPNEPGPESLTVALPAALLPLAVKWNWSPEYPIVVFTGPFWGMLTQKERDVVWDRWGVSVYEYRLDAAGSVVALECEAHNGLHLVSGAAVPDEAIVTRCECGQTSPRLATETDEFAIPAA